MLGSLGLPELIFIMVLALLIFGPKRLPEIGRTIGKGLSEFRKASNDLKRTIDTEILAVDDERRLPTGLPVPPNARPARHVELPAEAPPQPQTAPGPADASTPATPEPDADAAPGPPGS